MTDGESTVLGAARRETPRKGSPESVVLELADTLAHPFSKAYALGCAAWFNLYLRDTKTALARAREAVDLSVEQGFLWWQVWGTILGGRRR